MGDQLTEKSYPYESGDVTVLGPETFIDRSTSVISHKGENYYAKDDDDLAAWERAALGLEPTSVDVELDALKRVVAALRVLDDEARGRAVRYLNSRFGG